MRRRALRPPLVRMLGVMAGCLLAAGCATWTQSFREIERHLAAERYAEALEALERQGDADREPLLYQLNKGMLLHMAGRYAASNDAFEQAKRLIEHYSALSLREQGAMFVINDAASAYAGEEHEHVLVHLYAALNYLALGDRTGARVEALQVDLRLREQAARGGSDYVESAFARYLAGMIYEDLGEWSDALIAYRKSYEAYQRYRERYGIGIPEPLKHDLLRLTQYLGLRDEQRRYQEAFGIAEWTDHAAWRRQGELVFILHNGLAPTKQEQVAAVLDPTSGHYYAIALPYYRPSPPAIRAARLEVNGIAVETEVYEDVQALAKRTLDLKMPAITARALARMVVKARIAKAAREQARRSNDNSLAGLLLSLTTEVATVVTERADTRSWATLPSNIQLARIALPPGSYDVRVELRGSGSVSLGAFDLHDVAIEAGRKTYVSRHVVAANP
ncbi:MAG TPA: hypothetical protein VF203_00305 [Burkholderiales bacterium]